MRKTGTRTIAYISFIKKKEKKKVLIFPNIKHFENALREIDTEKSCVRFLITYILLYF